MGFMDQLDKMFDTAEGALDKLESKGLWKVECIVDSTADDEYEIINNQTGEKLSAFGNEGLATRVCELLNSIGEKRK